MLGPRISPLLVLRSEKGEGTKGLGMEVKGSKQLLGSWTLLLWMGYESRRESTHTRQWQSVLLLADWGAIDHDLVEGTAELGEREARDWAHTGQLSTGGGGRWPGFETASALSQDILFEGNVREKYFNQGSENTEFSADHDALNRFGIEVKVVINVCWKCANASSRLPILVKRPFLMFFFTRFLYFQLFLYRILRPHTAV